MFSVLVEKPEEKKPIGKLGCRWEDIKMDLTEMGWDGMD
jgi:hypothetical protein